MTEQELPELTGAMKILSRAGGLDDLRNNLRAYVGTGKSGLVEWLLYIPEKQFRTLSNPDYLTVLIEPGAHLNDF